MLTVNLKCLQTERLSERYKEKQSVRIYEEVTELLSPDPVWKLFFIPETTQAMSLKERPKQDYQTMLRSERQKSNTTQRDPILS